MEIADLLSENGTPSGWNLSSSGGFGLRVPVLGMSSLGY
jgi:hypothetical protein